MADKETGLNITVGAVADENSAKKAAKDINKAVNSSVKGGHIEVPVDITVAIDENNNKLTKAQETVTEKIHKMTAKGFSASKNDIKDLRGAFDDLTAAMDKAHRGRNTKIYQEIRKQVESIENSYNAMIKATRTGNAKVKTKNNTSDYLKQKTSDYQKRRAEQKKLQKEAIDNAVDIHNREVQNKELAGKGPNRLGSTSPTQNISRPSDAGRTSDEVLLRNEYSEHGSNWADELARTLKEEIGEAAKSLITEIYKTAEDMDNAIKEKHKNDKKQKAKIQGVGANSRETTEEEFLDDIFKKALGGFTKLLVKQEKGDTSLTEKDYIDQLSILKIINDKRGKDLEQTYNDIKGALLTPYSDSEGKKRKRINGTWAEEGTIKGEGKGHKLTNETIKKVYSFMNKLWDATDPLEKMVKRFYQASVEGGKISSKIKKGSAYDDYTSKIGNADETKAIKELANKVQTSGEKTQQEIAKTNSITEKQINYDKIEHDAERVADSQAGKKTETLIKETEEDANDGFNSDEKANAAIQAIKEQKTLSGFSTNLKDMMCPCESVLQNILKEIQKITTNGLNLKGVEKNQTKTRTSKEINLIPETTKALTLTQENIQKSLVPVANTLRTYYEGKDLFQEQKNQRILEEDNKRSGIKGLSRSTITTTRKDPSSWLTKLIDAFEQLTGVTDNYRIIMSKTSKEQDAMNANLVKKYGLTRGRSATDTGDKIAFARSMSLWRGKDKFKDLFKDLDLSKGVMIDTTAITDKLAKALSGKEMFKAQTGGWLNNMAGAATGGLAFAFQPSLEKSRARAEGLNQIMANTRESVNDVLNKIEDVESKLSGMEGTGDLLYKADGTFDLENSSEDAKALVAQLENLKDVLASILADVGMIDQVADRTHGKIGGMIKQLGFTSQSLRKNNSILANLNAGLDKNGKALKFQTRLSEILNYSFQLMGRHIGQIFKNLLLWANPLNLIKKAFDDFTSYDVKWQRTMNVIKYNFRRIVRPFMEWIAQQLVNILGLINAVVKGIGAAFGQNWDLFDQSAASAEQMREELEQAANVTASFDELHDIGTESSNNPPMDLMGDIYTPQWEDLYKVIEEKVKNAVEKLIPIFKKLGDVLKWCLDHWKALVAAFAAFKIAQALWKLLDWLGLLGKAFKFLGSIGLGNLLSWLAIVAGAILEIKTLWDSIQWAKNFYGVNPDERREQGDKNIKQGEVGGALMGGGIGFLAGGPAGAVVGAALGDAIAETAWGSFNTAVSMWKGDTESVKHFSKSLGEGIGKIGGTTAGAVLGFMLGGPAGMALGAGIGWVIGGPLGKAMGDAIGDTLNSILDVTRGVGAFQKLKVSAEDVEKAFKNVNEKTQIYNETLEELTKLEKQTGENGKDLYEAVENGTKSYWGLTDAQKAVYDQYQKVIEAENDMRVAKEQSFEVSAKWEEQLAKESGDYKKYIAVLQDGVDQGIISQNEFYDHLAQTYGSLDAKAKEVFIDDLPAYMRQSVKEQGAEYETFGNKIATKFNEIGQRLLENNRSILNSITEGWQQGGLSGAIEGLFKGVDNAKFAESTNTLKLLQSTEEDLKRSTNELAEAQEHQAKLQSEVDELQKSSTISAEELYNQLSNGDMAFSSLTKNEQDLVNKYAELQEAMNTTNDVAQKHTTIMADLDLQAATSSDNYGAFITHLVEANERGEISTEEMYNLMSQAYADMNTDARTSFEEQAKDYGILVENVRNGSTEYLGILGKLQIGAENIWSGISSWIGTKSQEIWTTVTTKFGEVKTAVEQIWENMKQSAMITWEDMKNSAIGQKAQEIWTNVTTTFENIKTSVNDKWNNIVSYASQKWDELKNSAIGQKAQEIWTNVTTAFNNLRNSVNSVWSSVVSTASNAWHSIYNAITGWVRNIWQSVVNIFNNIIRSAQETWQRVSNFFSGNGFKTNEQVSNNRGGMNIHAYATGTDYVPNDGLAYLHQGEAVIPKKYNQPSSQDNSALESAIEMLTQQVMQIGTKVDQGIPVKGEFVQRGSDLVATVNRVNSKTNNILDNKVYAR